MITPTPTPIKTFIELKEKRLEALIRGGILHCRFRREDAYKILCGFTKTVCQGIGRMMKNDDTKKQSE